MVGFDTGHRQVPVMVRHISTQVQQVKKSKQYPKRGIFLVPELILIYQKNKNDLRDAEEKSR